MIIDARDDVVTLSGRLEKNLWLSIQAAAHLLLRQHLNGILIDASEITHCSPEGAKTFLDGLEYIERHRARIVLCQVPEQVMSVLRAVPGVRSQVPIAQTVEEARASLDLAYHARVREKLSKDAAPPTVLVPVLQGTQTVKHAIGLANILGTEHVADGKHDRGSKAEVQPRIQLAYVIVVPRSIALNAPLGEEEVDAKVLLDEAESFSAAKSLNLHTEVARTRDAADEIVEIAERSKAAKIVMQVPKESVVLETDVRAVIAHVLQKAPCEVFLTRMKD
ncbi:MAG TPA: hypothetical protein VGK19_23910 [Capsulimonadaceae bacterium]|jgi:anti-anti-sigma regulatory factor